MEPSAWDAVTAIATVITAVIAIVTAGIAIWAIINAKQDSRDRSRPVMVAEFRIHPDSETTVVLVVRNAGPSVARDVRVEFSPALESDPSTVGLMRRYGDSIPTIGPGQEMSNLWWNGALRGPDRPGLSNDIKTPEEVTVSISHSDDHGREFEASKFLLRVDTWRPSRSVIASNSARGCMNTIAKQSEKQAGAVVAIARYVSGLEEDRQQGAGAGT